MKIVDIADEIFRELDQPTDNSIPQIAFWIRVNVGTLNNLIFTEFAIDNISLEISPDPSIEEKSILKKIYVTHFYDMKIRTVLGAASMDAVVEVSADGATVRKVNRNQTSQILTTIKKQEQEVLDHMIESYKNNKAVPRQVAGDDTVAGGHEPHTHLNRTTIP